MTDHLTVDIDGRTISYRLVGRGTPLLLLHGAWSDSRLWRLQLETLADTHTVIAWDAYGCGGSDDPPAQATISDYADAVGGLIDQLGLQRPHILGLSLGGGLAIEVTRRFQSNVGSLILVSAYAGWKGSLPPQQARGRVEQALREADEPPQSWAPAYLPSFFAGPVSEALTEEVLAIMLHSRPAGIKAMIKALGDVDLRAECAAITVPTMVLHGSADSRASSAVAHQLSDRIASSQLVVLPHLGHLMSIEAPETFNAEVTRFLQSVDTRVG